MASDTPPDGLHRPMRLMPRPDLVAERHAYRGRPYWVVKDPVALKYYRFEEEEYFLLRNLDGRTGLEEIRDAFEDRFAPQKITLPELRRFLSRLHQSALVLSLAPGQGNRLADRSAMGTRRRRLASLHSVLSLRIPLFDANALLGALLHPLGWLFSRRAVPLVCCAAMLAGLFVLAEFNAIRDRLPSFHAFFGPGNWVWLAAALGFTKVWHELGHGLSCRRLGAECREMGVMFLVFTPCLYCNVSDSWMLPNKWHRAAIGAAGMYAELILAAACVPLFWFTQPGVAHYLALNVVFVSSVSTLIFNINPLLRYDGYYILSDLVEIPNLRAVASRSLHAKAGAWFLGLPEPAGSMGAVEARAWLACFAMASAAYRWFVTISVLWFLVRVLEPYGLKALGALFAVGAVHGLVVDPLRRLARFLASPGRAARVHRWRLTLSVGAGVGLVATAAFLPVPHYVRCGVVVQPRDAEAVYAPVPGSVVRLDARPGDTVRSGQLLARLDSVDVELAVFDLDAERRKLAIRRDQLVRRALDDERAAWEIDSVSRTLAALESQHQQRVADSDRLTLRAPRDGVFLPAAETTSEHDPDRLPRWSGRALDTHNLGATVDDAKPLGFIGDPARFHAVLLVDQRDLELVALHQPVDVFLNSTPGRRFRSRIEHIARRPASSVPASLSTRHGGPIPTRTDDAGRLGPQTVCYQALAPFDDPALRVVSGVTGRARIRVGSRTLAERGLRWARQAFDWNP